MRFRSPCGYDVTLILFSVGIYHRDLDAVYHADRINSDFTVVETIVFTFDGWTVENADRICKCDPVTSEIREVLGRIPNELHHSI